jgi:hypothetical protein
MDNAIDPLIIERARNVADGRPNFRIVWTAEQLQRIGQAIEEGDHAFLATLEAAMRQAFDAALTPQRG